MAGKTETFSDSLAKYVEASIHTAIADVFDQAIEQAVKDAQVKRDEVVASIAMKMS